MMRITNKMTDVMHRSNMNTNKTYLDKLNSQMSTEKKIMRPSDDPVVAIRALRLRGDLSGITQYYGANLPDAKAWVDVTQKAIDSTVDLLSNMKALCDQGANGTNDAEARMKIYEDLQANVRQIYNNGNANYAGRTVFTGDRTYETLTFTEDTQELYRGIHDGFNAADVKKNTYVEGALWMDDINALNAEDHDETTVKEDRVNRIRLSYDNIDREAKRTPVTGIVGNEAGTISGWGGSTDVTKYIDPERWEYTADGQSFSDTITLDGNNVVVIFDGNNPPDLRLIPDDPSTRNDGLSAKIEGTPEEYRILYNGQVYTVKKNDAGDYTADKGAGVTVNGDGSLTVSFMTGSAGLKSTVSIDAGKSFSDEDIPVEFYAEKTDTGEIRIPYGDLVYTVKQDDTGKYTADKNATVTENGNTLTLTLPGASPNIVTTLTVDKADPAEVYVSTMKDIYELDLERVDGTVYATNREETTNLVYRTELEGEASTGSVRTDPAFGLQSFELSYTDGSGNHTWQIEKGTYGRFWAVNPDSPEKDRYNNVNVVRNTDNSFTITVKTNGDFAKDGSSGINDERRVFHVSADGRTVTSMYMEHWFDIPIITSDAPVVTDSEGKDLTAYQYLALDPNDKNADAKAADAVYLLADTGELVFGSNMADTLSSLKDIPGVDTISVIYDKTSFDAGDLRPEHYFDAQVIDTGHLGIYPAVFDDHEQEISYSVGSDQKIRINTNASEVFDTQIAREAEEILGAIEEVNAAEEKVTRLKAMQEDVASYGEEDRKKISQLLDAANKELALSKNKLQKVYERGISSFGEFHDQANLAATACGARDNRLTLIENRLQEEQATVKTLASENENVDVANVAVEMQQEEQVYSAALQAVGRVGRKSLVDYL